VILCDIDHFKHYNDRYGHIAGDACLKQIAQILQNGVHRSTDVVARFGGEEFAIILPESDKRGGIAIAQRMLSMIAGSRIEHLGAPEHSVVSASFGVAATTPALGESVQSLLLLADQKLYEAKQAGRNRVANSQGS
jgi:diguanylate cyclase (GGDEF)-like protein